MKNGNIIFQSLLTVAVIALFVLHFTGVKPEAASSTTGSSEVAKSENAIVYVKMDSLLLKYNLHAEYLEKLEAKSRRLQADLARREENVMAEAQALQQAAPSLNPVQLNSAQRDYQRIENQYMTYRQAKTAELQAENDSLMIIVKDEIDNEVAKLQEEMHFDYVLQYAGTLLYGDSLKDITNDLVQRLNAIERNNTTEE